MRERPKIVAQSLRVLLVSNVPWEYCSKVIFNLPVVMHLIYVWMYTVKELPGTVSELASCSGVISPNGSAAYWITCCSHTGLTAPIGLEKAKCSVAKLQVNM